MPRTSSSQKAALADYLRRRKSISPAEARTVFGIERLAARMYDLRGVVNYRPERKVDAAGHRYTRYYYLGEGKVS